MNYKFNIHISTVKTKWFYVELEEQEYYLLNNFTGSNWTDEKVQLIIDGIIDTKMKPKEDSFEWATEDIFLSSNEHGVFLWNLIAERAGEKNTEKLGLRLTHDKFITFMEDFKKFIEENQS